MSKVLAVVTGHGGLSEEVVELANDLPDSYCRFTISPLLPHFTHPILTFSQHFVRTGRAIPLSPFHFDLIARELRSRNIEQVFFTGDFPFERFAQAYLGYKIGQLHWVADEKCATYVQNTPTELSASARYLIALGRLLDEHSIRPLLANEIFPQLNVDPGLVSALPVPRELMEQIPNLVGRIAIHLQAKARGRLRYPQAAIIDAGIIVDEEGRGTDDLLRRYSKRAIKHAPVLVKFPSAEFDPALDQPTIGPKTLSYCAAAGIRGIIICAETTVVVNRNATLQMINEMGMFLYALPFNQLRESYVLHFPDTWARSASRVVRHP